MQISNLIANAIANRLQVDLITGVPDTDPLKAKLVKIGRFQDDPTERFLYACVHNGNPEDPNYKDGIATLESFDNIGFKAYPREVGGGEFWWRRGIVEVGAYLLDMSIEQGDAAQMAHEFLGRVYSSVRKTYVTGIVDTFGERAIILFVNGTTMNESGGPPDNYIYRGKVFWQVLTNKP